MTIFKLTTMLLLVFFVGVLLLPLSAAAEQSWYNCTVEYAGPAGPKTYLVLSDSAASPAFTKKWFVASDVKAKEILAVALAAMTKNLAVALLVDLDSLDDYPTINGLLLKK